VSQLFSFSIGLQSQVIITRWLQNLESLPLIILPQGDLVARTYGRLYNFKSKLANSRPQGGIEV